MLKAPTIVILGRPNVGKSTLFNRLAGRRRALVGDEPGMTRDRLYAPAEWRGRRFEVVDTGGIIPADKELMASEILRQARVAIDEAWYLVLVVDGRQGAVPLDQELAALLRRTGKPLALAVNKADSPQHEALASEFLRLGIKHTLALSAEHGLGVDNLLDLVTEGIPATPSEVGPDAATSRRARRPGRTPPAPPQPDIAASTEGPAQDAGTGETADSGSPASSFATSHSPADLISVAIIGRPNVGKSTLLNRLLNEERSIVTPVAGTTRDAVDAEVEREGRRFRLVDTAGIRRKGKTHLLAEKLSVIQARKHLERSDVALLLLDATEGVLALDATIGGYAHESRRSVIIVVNKWDAVAKGRTTTQDFTRTVRERMKYLDYAPLEFISAQKGTRVAKLFATIVKVAEARRLRIPTAEMNRFVQQLDFDRAPSPGGKPLRIYYLTQGGVAPPTFIAFTNRAEKLHFSVERFLANRIRERFGFVGAPIVIKTRQSK